MIQLFSQEKQIEYRDKRYNEDFETWQDSVLDEIAAAGLGEFKSIKEVNEYNREVKRKNDEYAAGVQNYNLYEVFNTFIKEATIYKHKSDMKHEFDLSLYQVRNTQLNRRNGANKLINNFTGSKVSGKNITQTTSGVGSNIEKHLDEWLEAVFYENFDIDEGTRTKVVNLLLKYVSAKNMWLNLTAGIGNIAYNRAQINAEAHGGYYYDRNDLNKADKLYISSMLDMISNTGKEERSTLVGALINMFDITQNTNEKDYAGGMLHKKLLSLDSMYMFNNIGEHYS